LYDLAIVVRTHRRLSDVIRRWYIWRAVVHGRTIIVVRIRIDDVPGL